MDLLERESESYLRGVVRVEQTGAGLLLHRFTETQLAYLDRQPAFTRLARSPAGCRLWFVTDSCSIELFLAVPAGDATLPELVVDVEVDGCVIAVGRKVPAEGVQPLSLRLFDAPGDSPAVGREVCIHLPYYRPVLLQALRLDDQAHVDPLPRQAKRLLVMGDFIAQGALARSSFGTMATQLGRLLDMELLNQGLGNHVFDEGLIDGRLPYSPDLVVVAYGTSDWGIRTQEQECRHVAAFVAGLRRLFDPHHTGLAVVTPLWRYDLERLGPGGTLVDFSTAIAREAAAVAGVHVIDGFKVVPQRQEFFSDGVHPNEAGMLHAAVGLAVELRRAGLA